MILVRGVSQARYGKSDELVQLIKEANETWPMGRNRRILTDLSGPFFTVITETEFESLTEWEAERDKFFGDPRFSAWFERLVPLVESGRREFYNIAG